MEEKQRRQSSAPSFAKLARLKKGEKKGRRGEPGTKRREDGEEEGPKKIAKRKNKNKPIEMTSKVPTKGKPTIGKPTALQYKPRDPRFDGLCGKLNDEMFRVNYTFVQDYKEKEMERLRDELVKEKDPEMIDKLRSAIGILQQQVATHKSQEGMRKRKQEQRKQERELVLQGKKPFFLKEKDRNKQELLHRFEKLKQNGQLDKYLTKKRKRTAQKEHKHIPWRRREKPSGSKNSKE